MMMPEMVRLGFLVTAAIETGAIVVPWQAKPITAKAETKPVKPPWRSRVSAGKGAGKINLGNAENNKQCKRSYQNQSNDVFQNGDEAGTLMVERKNSVIAMKATSV